MKVKHYEKCFCVYIFEIFIIIIFLLSIFLFNIRFIKTYDKIHSTIIKDNLVYALIDNKELETIYKNKYIIINKKRQLIKIVELNKNVLSRNKKSYHSVIFEASINNKYKENDNLELLLFNKKISTFSMLRMIWRG